MAKHPYLPAMQGLVALSRLGVYIRVPGVDVAKFEQSIQGGGLLGYIDALSGGSISKVGVFSLGQQALNQQHCSCTIYVYSAMQP